MALFLGSISNNSIKEMSSTRPRKSDSADGVSCQLHERKLLQSSLRNAISLAKIQSEIFRYGRANKSVSVIRASHKFLGGVSVWLGALMHDNLLSDMRQIT